MTFVADVADDGGGAESCRTCECQGRGGCRDADTRGADHPPHSLPRRPSLPSQPRLGRRTDGTLHPHSLCLPLRPRLPLLSCCCRTRPCHTLPPTPRLCRTRSPPRLPPSPSPPIIPIPVILLLLHSTTTTTPLLLTSVAKVGDVGCLGSPPKPSLHHGPPSHPHRPHTPRLSSLCSAPTSLPPTSLPPTRCSSPHHLKTPTLRTHSRSPGRESCRPIATPREASGESPAQGKERKHCQDSPRVPRPRSQQRGRRVALGRLGLFREPHPLDRNDRFALPRRRSRRIPRGSRSKRTVLCQIETSTSRG